MGDVQAAVSFDRLPWLADEPQTSAPRRRRRAWPLWLGAALAALAALVAIAGLAYWIGTRNPAEQPLPGAPTSNRPPVTVPLPAPVEAPPPQPQVEIEPLPEVAPVMAPPLPVMREAPKARHAPVRPRARATAPPPRAAKAAPAASARPRSVASTKGAALPIWPVRAEQHSAGRLVRVGTFANERDAKRGWTKVMHFYPAMARLPALVVPIRAVPSGRQYFRLQMGTTSQAHSEVLCQRMRIIGVSCVVLDIGTTRR